ncbi:MAG TPA: 16S rRNA (guanine(527)-N(7))-methyltransferase RsmG [Candidatus Lustribacter sp.]|jgi:16S rRNA (guanine527-N7)-methyltransferase|nr:16S rRNA (guanine(527)-N(7))-methyltransferase RsmG [Candidatus Lustribacter sp.]
MPGEDEALAAALYAAGIADDLGQRLAAYGALLLEANRKVNLTGAKDAEALVPHLLDALALAGDVRESLVDVGSGGGLPGIPLALATGARVVLIEPTAKKAAFLKRALEECGVDGEVLAERAEVAAREGAYREQFVCATARAVASAPTVAELTVPFLRLGGRALLQRGRTETRERQALEDAAPMLGAALVEARWTEGERVIFVLEKLQPTSPRFPRRNGVPEKRPLCL